MVGECTCCGRNRALLNITLEAFCDSFIMIISRLLLSCHHVFFLSLAVSPLIPAMPRAQGCMYLCLIDDEHYCLALAHRVCCVCFERCIIRKCSLSLLSPYHTEGQEDLVNSFCVYLCVLQSRRHQGILLDLLQEKTLFH